MAKPHHYDSRVPLVVDFTWGFQGIDEHTHSTVELIFILGGRLRHVVNGRRYPMTKGDVFVINPGTRHGFEDCHDLEECKVCYRPEVLEGLGPELRGMSAFHTLFMLAPVDPELNFACRLRLDETRLHQALVLANAISRELQIRENDWEPRSRRAFAALIRFLCEAYHPPVEPNQAEGTALQVAQVMAYIESHFAEPLRVEALAEGVGCSRRHLARQFHRALGMGPMDYLAQVRLREAKRLLTQSAFEVQRVAAECGYPDHNYFSRHFKASVGMTPTSWRERTAR